MRNWSSTSVSGKLPKPTRKNTIALTAAADDDAFEAVPNQQVTAIEAVNDDSQTDTSFAGMPLPQKKQFTGWPLN